MLATSSLRWFYQHLAKPLFFRRDPEEVHDAIVFLGERLGRLTFMRTLIAAVLRYDHAALEQNVLGLTFKNPIGLAAGFDKNAQLTQILPSIGFGFEEVGSITGEPCAGNPKPRLWRLPKSRGLVVYYGLKNDGCEAIARRLRNLRFAFPLGISVAKTNTAATIEIVAGIADYVKAFTACLNCGDYFTINISCPNAFGGEPFTEPDRLDALLKAIDAVETTKPIFLKLPADFSIPELDALLKVCDDHRVHGLIFSNLTKRRDRPQIYPAEIRGLANGGISGKAVFETSNALLSHAYSTRKNRYVLIGCGGVFSAADAYAKIRCGASLVQMVTGMIFEGPQVIGEINRDLVRLLKRDGFTHLREAIGTATV